MKYLANKALLATFALYGAFAQSTVDPSNPSLAWDEYTELKCEEGYNKVVNFCVWCDEDEGKFFDEVTKQCRKCPKDTTFNAETKKCECPCDPPRYIDPLTKKCQCTSGRQFLNEICVCPSENPLWNGKKCVRCPPGTDFEPKDKQCYHCPEGFKVDPGSHSCIPALGH